MSQSRTLRLAVRGGGALRGALSVELTLVRMLFQLGVFALLTSHSAAQYADAERRLDDHVIEDTLRRFDGEPSIDALLSAVRELPELDPAVARRLRRRARRAGLLPRLFVRGRRGQGVDLNERLGEVRTSTDDSLTLEATLEWRLDGAAFSSAEPQLVREEARRAAEQNERKRLVVSVYFERRRLQLEERLLPPGDRGAQLRTAVRIRELAALLDALTDGAFGPAAEE